ncbi:DedA family protein [Treponema pedis]|uniref:DedA integral membrane protein n=2 Tax=Treponema pedis TaxID=409322 RepID=S6A2H5_9SPIR|nr:DedA family protein [Treponema pedis]AGT42646.1 DedA integral membrane protein [Treponema pedis str. T A4]QOW61664.1 DedA family protein [Treponema pedis]QSI03537.1 DedA family protein [Treponema pedis]
MLFAILNWLGNYISYFPLVVFIGLVLGGFNLPIPEDVLVIMSAVMCQQEKASVPSFLIALYAGAVLSDYMVYFWGRLIAKGSFSMGVFSKVIKKDNTYRLLAALQKYGIFTYIISRFIPFGVRNVVSITSGFVKYPFYKFAVYDLIAALCNISVLFGLVYFFGATGSRVMKIAGIVLFIVFLGFGIYLIKSGKLFTLADKRLEKAGGKKAV